MQTTPKLGLKKPDLTDYVSIADLNENMDALDTAVGKLKEGTTLIPDLQTDDKTLAGAINEVDGELTTHLAESMPHQYVNVENNKTYRWGLGQDSGGIYFVREEVI